MRLEMLGGLRLLDSAGMPVAVQRRRLALLAILGAAGRRGVSRERLLALLWPDSPDAPARHALDQALSALRRQLGAEAFARGGTVALNPEVVSVDLWEVEQALATGTRIAELARWAPPLECFHLDDAPDFSHWLDAERASVAERHSAAIAAQAESALARGDAAEAAGWWRAYQRVDPLAARGAVGLVRALGAAGDGAGARRFARTYETLVRAELDCDPDPALAAALAAIVDVPAAPVLPPARTAPAGAVVPEVSMPSPGTDRSVAANPPAAPVRAAAPASRRPWRRWMALAAAVGLALLAVSAVRSRPRPAAAPSGVPVTVVFPFRVVDSTGGLGYLSEAMVDLLAVKFASGDQLRVLPPGVTLAAWHEAGVLPDAVVSPGLAAVARRLGASRILTGSAVGGDEALVLGVTLSDAAAGRTLLEMSVRGPRDSVPALVDRLVAQLLLAIATGDPQATTTLGATPMAALHAYLAGEAAARAGRLEDAVRLLREAIDHDSTFALAAMRLADVAEWMGPSWTWNPAEVKHEALRIAWANRDRLSSTDRALLVADAGPDFPVPSSELAHLDAWSRAVNLAPARAEAWLGFGDYLFHSGPLIGRADAHRRAWEAFTRAVALDSGRVAALGHLADLDAASGDTVHLRTAATAYLRLSPGAALGDFVRWRLAAAVGDASELAALHARWDRMPLESLLRIAVAMQADALRLDELEEVARVLERRLYESADPRQVNEVLVDLELNAGRPTAAGRRMRAWRERVTAEQVAVRLAGDALLAGGDRDAALRALGQLGPPARLGPGALCARALLEADADPRLAAEARAVLARKGAQPTAHDTLGVVGKSHLCALTLGVLLPAAPAARRAAAHALDSALQTGPPSFDVTMSGGDNLLLARAWAALGERDAALAAVRRRAYGGLWPTRFLADALREEGTLALAAGDSAGATRAWHHHLALRSRVEPGLEAERERVERNLAALQSH